MSTRNVLQMVVVEQGKQNYSQPPTPVAFFNPDGTPLEISGGEGGSVTWANIPDKPAVVAEGATQAAARDAIGAGTSSLAVSTTAPAAPAAAAAVGTGTTAARADHAHVRQTGAQTLLTGYVAGTASAVAAGDTANAAIAKLEARIIALEAV